MDKFPLMSTTSSRISPPARWCWRLWTMCGDLEFSNAKRLEARWELHSRYSHMNGPHRGAVFFVAAGAHDHQARIAAATVTAYGSETAIVVFAWVFPNFHRALPAITQQRVNEQAAARNCAPTGEGLFLHAYSIVTGNEKSQARLDDFRNQYGFARNMCFAFSASAIVILISRRFGSHPVRLRWALLAGFASVALFYRYLKFFHQYSYELLLRYAELPRS